MTSDKDRHSRAQAPLGRLAPSVEPTESLIEDIDLNDSLPELAAPPRPALGTGQFGGSPSEATSVESPAAKAQREAGLSKPRPAEMPGLPASPPRRNRRTTASRPDRPEERIGQVLGSYRLLDILGKGGMGAVYRAEHIKLGRSVALKLLRPDYAERKDSVARFFQEARAVNRVRHRNIVDVTDLVELDDGLTFIIMELLTGYSLGKWARSGFQISRAVALFIQICDGLAAAHDVGIVHRDLKPDNVFVVPTMDGAELIKILDFGVAKLLHREDEDYGLETAVGAVIGTPAFMSPEQAGGMDIDHRSDIYSLGAIMYEVMCGQPMFRAKSFGEYVRKHLNEAPVPPRDTDLGKLIDDRFAAVIMRCLAKRREDRFQTVRELRTALLELLGGMDTDIVPLYGLSSDLGGLELISESRSGPVQVPAYLTTGPHGPVPTLGQAGDAIPDLRPYTGRKRWIAVGAALASVLALGFLIVRSLGESAPPSPASAPAVAPTPTPTPSVEAMPGAVPTTGEPAPAERTGSFVVRIDSAPPAKVYADNDKSALCTTPCDVSIERAGPPTQRYTLRKDGYLSAELEIDVDDPRETLFVALDPVPAAGERPSTGRPSGGGKPASGDRHTGSKPAGGKDPGAGAGPTASGGGDQEPGTGSGSAKEPVKTPLKPPKDVKPTDTLDPFGAK